MAGVVRRKREPFRHLGCHQRHRHVGLRFVLGVPFYGQIGSLEPGFHVDHGRRVRFRDEFSVGVMVALTNPLDKGGPYSHSTPFPTAEP